jgi:chemotaxis protein histidine kinase CheA
MSSSSSSNKYNTPISGNTENGTEGQLTIDIRPLLEDVSQVMTKHISHILSGVVGEYTVYKETHNTIMGLPCVRKLQERITDLENQLNGGGGPVVQATASAASSSTSPSEISELQTAIVELNRYIQVLESRVDVKNIHQSHQPEEAIRLEVQENDLEDDDEDADEDEPADEPVVDIPPSFHTNHIVDSSIDYNESVDTDAEAVAEAAEEDTEAAVEEAEEDTEAAAEAEEEAEEEAEAEEAEDTEAAEEEEADDAEEDTEAEDAEATAEVSEAEEPEEAEDTEAEDAEAAAEVSEAEEAEAPEEEIEVSEIKIKGVTYFTTNAQNGIIYACVDDDVGDEVGVFKNGVALFNKAAATKK